LPLLHVDIATKHLIQLLQELYQTGAFQSANRVSTATCNAALESLLRQMPGADKTQAYARRADAILQTAELFDGWRTLPQRLPYPVPRPNYRTYFSVLQIHSRTAGDGRAIPERATDIVRKMEWRYRQLGDLDMKPGAALWNMVLMAWCLCGDWEKPAHAARLVFDKLREPGQLDGSSLLHFVRICNQNRMDEEAAVLGARVATELWRELFDGNQNAVARVPELKSHFYSHFLQAIRPLGINARSPYFDDCFQRACNEGKLNVHILQEFFVHAKKHRVFEKHLGFYKHTVKGMSPEEAVPFLLQQLPDSWKHRAD
jgi:hypothetical protein